MYKNSVVCESLEDRQLFSAYPLGDNAKFGTVNIYDSRPIKQHTTITQLDSVAGKVNIYLNPAHAHHIWLTFTHGSKKGDMLVFRQEGGLVVVIPLTKLSVVNLFGGAQGDNVVVRGKGNFTSSTPVNFYEGIGRNTIKNPVTYSDLHFFSDVPIEEPVNPRHVF